MSGNNIYPVSPKLAANSLLTNDQYLSEYKASIVDETLH